MVAQLDLDVVRARPSRVVPRALSYALFEGRPATTRGQWFNGVVGANLALGERASSFLGWDERVESPIAIVGIGRSGTTLLGRLFGVHPHVGFLNEPKAMWHRIVSDEDLIGSYGPEPVRLRLGREDATPEVIGRAHRLFGWYLGATRSRRLVDKYPELVYRARFLRGIFPDAHIVPIVRRPWDVISSIDAWGDAHGTDDADWWGIDDRKWRVLWEQEVSVDRRWAPITDAVDPHNADATTRAAVEWTVGTSAALDLASSLGPQRVHIVRYEQLVADPTLFMTDLLQACELPVEPSVLALARSSVARQRPPSGAPAELASALVDAVESVAARVGYI